MPGTTITPRLHDVRADFVGSFLRPQTLKDAYAAFDAGTIDAAALRAAQDDAIRELIVQQERCGLPIAGDGEFRRRMFMESFAEVAGLEEWRASLAAEATLSATAPAATVAVKGSANRTPIPVTQRLALKHNALLDEYGFASRIASKPVKVTIVGPQRMLSRFDVDGSRSVYPGGAEEFLRDVISVERQMIGELYAAGCRYLQLDSSPYTAYADPASIAELRARGEDPREAMERAIAADNAVMTGLPEMTFGVHLCRGNKRGHFHREGTYDSIAERLFNALACDRFLLEYDDERSGGFEPLRFVPKGKVVVLGLITTKHGELESVDELRRRIDEAARYLDIGQLALSPQCGFASALAGNALSEEAQWQKIEVMLETVRAIWG